MRVPARLTLGLTLALTLALALLLPAPRPALAAASAWLDHEQAQVRLLAAGGGAEAPDRLSLGLQFRLEPGWKIYWRTPGEAGFPPELDWSGSDNLAAAELQWPAPHRFTLFGLDTFGYSDEVVLPIEARLERPGEPLYLEAALTYLICSEICIPHDGTLRLDIAAGGPGPSAEGFLIGRAQSLVPGDGSGAGLSVERAVLVKEDETPLLEVVARSSTPFEDPDLLVEGPPGFVFQAPEVTLSDDGKEALLRLASRRGPLAEGVLEGKLVTLTLTDGRRGMETTAITRYEAGAAGPAAGVGLSLLQVLALALLGGLILNLMPCVLPVLSIKLLSVAKSGGRDRAEVRLGFLASSFGILFSFLLLAAGLIALKATGMAVGWGIQFQQPLFLTAMALLITLFACNLFGFFEILLPGRLANFAGREQGHGLIGHFAAGAFATLLATPCSAPFLGTAVGFALARGAGEIVFVFTALAVGLAAPYLLIAAVPQLATRLPRPGHWMVTLRRVLGFALAATAVWLVSVLAGQVGLMPALLVAGLLIALGLVLAFRRRLPVRLATTVAAGLAVVTLLLPAGLAPRGDLQAAQEAGALEAGWLPFDEIRLAGLVADGRVVFVDVTADWCLTCQVNKEWVIDSDALAATFADPMVVRMRADWTLPSEAILDYLASFGRYGIPFDAVYGPGAPAGTALPELLTVDAVLAAISEAGGATPQETALDSRPE